MLLKFEIPAKIGVILPTQILPFFSREAVLGHLYNEGKITRPIFFYRIHFSILGKLFALTILRVEFGHFYLNKNAQISTSKIV
jgi:hypothetical protein